MPFDGMTFNPKTAARIRLIEALRAPMPAGFAWRFSNLHVPAKCGAAGCAVGLAYEIGLVDAPCCYKVADAIGLDRRQARKIFMPFLTTRRYGTRSYGNITPAMVADKIEMSALINE